MFNILNNIRALKCTSQKPQRCLLSFKHIITLKASRKQARNKCVICAGVQMHVGIKEDIAFGSECETRMGAIFI